MNSKILTLLVKLKNKGLSEDTLRNYHYRLATISNHANLDSSEDVLRFISNVQGSNQYKESFVKAYTHYARFYQLEFDKPKYKIERKLPKIPSTETVNMFIARASRKYSTVFKLLAETGIMPKELHNVTVRDIDLEKGLLNVQGFKGHASRVFKLKSETVSMLRTYIALYSKDKFLFPNSKAMGKAWIRLRNILTDKLHDSKYSSVRLYDLRHYYACQTYHRTNNILYVMKMMGHKKIETTLVYVQLLDDNEPEYVSAVANNVKEATRLIESGYEYVCKMDNVSLFRKRK